MMPAIIDPSSDSCTDGEGKTEGNDSPEQGYEIAASSVVGSEASLQKVDTEFARLLPFVGAGLRNIGRVGAEPVWERLADRLEWERRKDRVQGI